MITERDFSVKYEQHQDRLQEAERERLLKQIANECSGSTIWQDIGRWVTGKDNQEQDSSYFSTRSVCGGKSP